MWPNLIRQLTGGLTISVEDRNYFQDNGEIRLASKQKPGPIVQDNGRMTLKAFWTGPTITGPEFKGLGAHIDFKKGGSGCLTKQALLPKYPCCAPQPPGATHGSHGGFPCGGHK